MNSGYYHTASFVNHCYEKFTDCKNDAEVAMQIRGLKEVDIYHQPFGKEMALIQRLTNKEAL